MANTTIAIKKSGTPAAVPGALANGELAINYADGLLYYKNATGQIVSISGSGGNSFGIANVDNILILSGTGNDVLNFRSGNGVNLSACTTTKTITFNGTTNIPISPTAPSSPTSGDAWWNSNLGRLFLYYNDGDTSQWVEATPAGGVTTSTTGSDPSAFNHANAAFDKANSANVLAFNTGIGANTWANTKLANTSGVSFAGDLYFPSGCVAIGIASASYPFNIVSGGVTPLTGLTGALATAEGTTNGTNQFNLRNAGAGAAASSDYIATTNDGSETTNFIDLGINNSGYNAPAFWTINGPRDGYLYMPDGNLSIGVSNTTSAVKFVNFFVGGALAADEVMRIQDSTGGANVGIGTTSPDYKLCVTGTINAANILVNQTPVVVNAASSLFLGTANNTNFVGSANSTEVLTASIGFIIDGGGSVVTTGQKGHIEVPFNCTINQWTMLLDQSGSANVEIWKDTYANFPPTNIDTINTGGFLVSSATKNQGSLFNVTSTINAGDILAYNVATVATATRITVSLRVTKT